MADVSIEKQTSQLAVGLERTGSLILILSPEYFSVPFLLGDALMLDVRNA